MEAMPMDYHQICQLLDRFQKHRILVIGDLMLDRYVWGKVERISPEAPIQIFSIQSEEYRLGGAGNTIQNLADFGAHVSSIGVVGKDEAGTQILERLKQKNVDISGLVLEPSLPTTIKTRLIAKNQQVLRMDREWDMPFPLPLRQSLKEYLESLDFSKFAAIVISDYGKGMISSEMMEYVLKEGKKWSIPTLVDPKGMDYNRYYGATVITPNRIEAEQATSISIDGKDSLISIAKELHKKLALTYVVITLGDQGIFLWDGKEEFLVQGKSRSVYDVTGAGDTVIATLAMAMASHISLRKGVELANYIASMVVEELGAASFTPLEILDRARKEDLGTDKLLTLRECKWLAKNLKKSKKTLVFTNGCFDLFHPGHLHLLKFAKEQGDFLLVGLNSDHSIQQIKGKNRPFFHQRDRVAILSSLQMVDGIILFDTPTPLELIQAIQPDILVKGEEYRNKIVVGREIVEESGGKVLFAPKKEGFSTTDLAKKISKKLILEEDSARITWEK